MNDVNNTNRVDAVKAALQECDRRCHGEKVMVIELALELAGRNCALAMAIKKLCPHRETIRYKGSVGIATCELCKIELRRFEDPT